MDSLDLCLSCGGHVPDGSAYCSSRCLAMDQSPRNSFSSAPVVELASSSAAGCSRNWASSQAGCSSSPQRTYEVGPRSAPLPVHLTSPIHKFSGRDRTGISIWAQGVYGGGQYVGDNQPLTSTASSFFEESDDEEEQLSLRSSRKSTSSGSSSLKRKLRASPISHSAPRFPLTAAHLAPPTLISIHTLPHPSNISIATTTADDESSLMTPHSSPASSLASKVRSWVAPSKDTTPTRPTYVVEESTDPWISSPPYDFTIRKQPQPKSPLASQRGRSLVRPEW